MTNRKNKDKIEFRGILSMIRSLFKRKKPLAKKQSIKKKAKPKISKEIIKKPTEKILTAEGWKRLMMRSKKLKKP